MRASRLTGSLRPSRLRTPVLALSLTCLLATAASAQSGGPLNRTIQTLSQGHPVFGIFAGDFSAANARALARSSLDYVFIDMEPNGWDAEALRIFLLGMTDREAIARSGSLQMAVTPIVRIPTNGREMLQAHAKQALDMGVFGIMFPFVDTREEAENAVASMRFPRPLGSTINEPWGIRGRSPSNAAIWYWGMTSAQYFEKADVWPLNPQGELLAVIQIETPAGVANIEEIITVPGVGVIFVGPLDLATQMGYGDQLTHPDVEAAIQSVLGACVRHDVPCGLTTTPDNVAARIQQGFQFVTVGVDAGLTPTTVEALRIGREAAGR